MRPRAGMGLMGWIRSIRSRPVLAVGLSALSVALIASAIVFTTPLRCGPARAMGLKGIANGCITAGIVSVRTGAMPIVASPPFPGKGNPASAPYPPYGNPASPPYGNPASGPYPPVGYPASGSYPPFYPPASGANGSVATLPLNCRLPVYAGPPGSGGFIAFPGGAFIADPASSVSLPASSPATSPPAGPGPGYGQGYTGLTYDHPYSRWLPVPSNQVSPDGNHYAYTLATGIYVVDMVSGTQSELGDGHSWAIVSVQSDGIDAGDPNTGGLWTFPFSGTPRQITNTGYWRAASRSAAYGTATSAVPQGATNSIVRLDLKTGAITDWFTRAGAQSSVAGVDGQGNPIINVNYLNGSGNEIWVAASATSALPIAGFSSAPYGSTGFNSYSLPVADSHGLWFSGNWSTYGSSVGGVALYVAGSGLYWMSSIGGQLAGGCY
jgi:hypothetical protein